MINVGQPVVLAAEPDSEVKRFIEVTQNNKELIICSVCLRQIIFFPSSENQTVNNPINAAEDTLQIIRLQIGGSERAGRGGRREGCWGND